MFCICRYAIICGMKKKITVLSASLLALFAVRLAFMATMPVFEPSEARYAAIAANMARTGDFLVPHFTCRGEYCPFAGKPPLVFQTGAVFCRILGVNEFAVRLMPFLSYLFLLAIVFCSVKKLAGAASACLALGICATCVPLYGTAGLCMTDVPLSCCVAGSLMLYACHRADRRLGYALGIGALLGCGMLIKGPVAVALFALPVMVDAVVNRKWSVVFDWRWIVAMAVLLVIAAPWFVIMEMRTPGFMRYFFVNENLLRYLVHDYGDRYGSGRETFRGMALAWMFVVALPWSLVQLRYIWGKRRYLPVARDFFFVSFVSITAFWCLTSRVPMTYLLPAAPLFAAWLAQRCGGMRMHMWRMLPLAVIVSELTVASVMLVGYLCTDKMRGESSLKKVSKRHFAYEFYHGPWGRGAPQ